VGTIHPLFKPIQTDLGAHPAFSITGTEDNAAEAWRWAAPPSWVKVRSGRATPIQPHLYWWHEL